MMTFGGMRNNLEGVMGRYSDAFPHADSEKNGRASFQAMSGDR